MSTILPQQDSAHLRYSNEVQLVAASLTCRSRPHRYHTQHQKWPLRAKAVTLFSYKWARNKVHSSTMAAHKAVPTLHAHRYAWCYLQARTLVVVKEPRKGAEKPALALWTDHTGRGCGHKGARSNQHPAHWAGGWATPGAAELTGRVATSTQPYGRVGGNHWARLSSRGTWQPAPGPLGGPHRTRQRSRTLVGTRSITAGINAAIG